VYPAPATLDRCPSAEREVVLTLLGLVDALGDIHAGLPPPFDFADRQEHCKPYDVATDILATVECVLADSLRPAVQSLQRSAQVTDVELEREHREWLKTRERRPMSQVDKAEARSIGLALLLLRRARGLTPEELSAASGVTRPDISRFETG
jgi:hypothetical protein